MATQAAPAAHPPPTPPSYDDSEATNTFLTRLREAGFIGADEGEEDSLPRYYGPNLPFKRLSGLLLPLFLVPLLLLLLVILAPDESMGSIGGFFKGILIPALIALTLYLLLHFALLPLYRRHRARYSQYLPVATQNPLSTLSSSTSGLRSRIQSAALAVLIPSRWAEWRYNRGRQERVHNAEDEEGSEMGEDLEFDIEDGVEADRERRRRDGLSLSIDARGARDASSDRRLSRELEEGFADSSDEEDEGNERRHDRRR